MASNITVDTLTKGSTTLNTDEIVDTNSSQVCKAWVNFNGTGTVAIRDSYNVASITDNGTGDYTVNFTTAMANANYSVSMSSRIWTSLASPFTSVRGDEQATTSFNTQHYENGSLVDTGYIAIQVFSN